MSGMKAAALSSFGTAIPAEADDHSASSLTANLGSIDFPNSGATEAQTAFLTGMKALHSFEFEDAGEAFREAQAIDPDFALAHWGEALSYNHPLWTEQDREAAHAALARYAPTPHARAGKTPSGRERDLMEAVDVLYGSGETMPPTRPRSTMWNARASSAAGPNTMRCSGITTVSFSLATKKWRDGRSMRRFEHWTRSRPHESAGVR